MMAAFYLHLGPFSRSIIRQLDQQIDSLRHADSLNEPENAIAAKRILELEQQR
jgi:hypothetical protein